MRKETLCSLHLSTENQEIFNIWIESGFIHSFNKYLFITSYVPEWCKRIHNALIKQNWLHPHLKLVEKEFGTVIKLILKLNIHRLKNIVLLKCFDLLEVKWNSITWLWLDTESLNHDPTLFIPKLFTPRQNHSSILGDVIKMNWDRDSNIFERNYNVLYNYFSQFSGPSSHFISLLKSYTNFTKLLQITFTLGSSKAFTTCSLRSWSRCAVVHLFTFYWVPNMFEAMQCSGWEWGLWPRFPELTPFSVWP